MKGNAISAAKLLAVTLLVLGCLYGMLALLLPPVSCLPTEQEAQILAKQTGISIERTRTFVRVGCDK